MLVARTRPLTERISSPAFALAAGVLGGAADVTGLALLPPFVVPLIMVVLVARGRGAAAGVIAAAGAAVTVLPLQVSAPVAVIGFLAGAVLVTQLVAPMRDERTQRDAVVEELERGQRVMREIVDVLPEAVLVYDRYGRLSTHNRRARDLAGDRPPGNIGALDAALGLEPERGLRALADASAQGRLARGDLSVRDRYGDTRTLAAAVSRVGDSAAGSRMVIVLTDITARQALERERLGFFAVIGHEVRNPLTILRAHVDILNRSVPADAPGLRTRVESASAQLDRTIRLFETMMDVSRLESGHFEMNEAMLDVAALTTALIERSRPAYPEHALVLEIGGHPVVHADRARVEEALDNLISNAVKYSRSGSTVVIAVRHEGSFAVVRVRDQGIGIPPEERSRLGNPFFRGSAARTYARGVGLGLYVSTEIVRRSGGRLWLEATSAEGSTFTLTLPLAA